MNRTSERLLLIFLGALIAVAGLVLALILIGTTKAAPPSTVALIETVDPSRSAYHLHDSAGHSMDTLKVMPDPTTAGRFLGVYHFLNGSTFDVAVATSTDLRTWTLARILETGASQPSLNFSPAPKNGPVLAMETQTDNHLRFRYWTTVSGFLGTGTPYISFDATRTLSTCAEGTPDVRSVVYDTPTSSINTGSTITVGHHYFSGCSADREALGTLRNFGTWTTAARPTVDTALTNAGALGNHGDRDTFTSNGSFELLEGNLSATYSPANWRNFLYDGSTAQQVNPHTAAGSTAFSNPTTTVATVSGTQSLIVTQFIPSEGAANGEAGELIYWNPLGPTPSPTPTSTPPPPTATPTAAVSPSPTPTPTPSPAGSISHVVIVWLENHEYGSVTSSSMPYLTGLGSQYGVSSAFYGVSHPSLPNYLAVWSGSTQGVTDDGTYNLSAANLSVQMQDAGKTWKAYQQNYPSTSGCHTASTYSGGVDGWGVSGTYARKHDPPMSFQLNGGATCSNILPLAPYNGAANLIFVTPNLCNDAHDCSLTTADNFLSAFLPQVFSSPQWSSTLLIVSFDEGSTNTNGGGHIYTMVARQGMAHLVSATVHNHYSVTRTVEDLFGLPCLVNACTAAPLSEFYP